MFVIKTPFVIKFYDGLLVISGISRKKWQTKVRINDDILRESVISCIICCQGGEQSTWSKLDDKNHMYRQIYHVEFRMEPKYTHQHVGKSFRYSQNKAYRGNC